MADFDIQYNGVPITSLVIPSNSSTSRQLTVVAKNGAASAGKLVQIGTSCLLFISDVNGNLDSHGKLNFVVGPGFSAKGNVSLTVSIGNKTKSLDVQFV